MNLSLGKKNPHEEHEEHFVRPGNYEEAAGRIRSGDSRWRHGVDNRVDVCWRRKARRSHRAQIHWRIVPEHRVPAKQNIIHSAKVASYFRRSKEFGITRDGFTIDMSGVRDRKRKMVSGMNDAAIRQQSVGDRSQQAVDVQRRRRCYVRLFVACLRMRASTFFWMHGIKRVSGKSGDSVGIVVERNGAEKVLKGSHVLVAAGRTPNTEELGLELAGVELTRPWMHQGQRATADDRARRLGDRRGCRQPAVHTHQR